MRRAARLGVGMLVAMVLIGGAAWLVRDSLPIPRRGASPVVEGVSPEAAAVAEDKLRTLRDDRQRVALSGSELTSLLRYRTAFEDVFGVAGVGVVVHDGHLTLGGMIDTERLPSHPDLDRVRPFLPDSAAIEIVGTLEALDPGHGVFHVREVSFAEVPIPRRYHGTMLARTGRIARDGLPDEAVAFPLPEGVREVRIEADSVIFYP
jgi:hypothetical protein